MEKAEATVWREVVNEETADAVAAGRDGGESGRGDVEDLHSANQVTVIGVAKRTVRACAVRGSELAANGWAEGHARLLG